MSRALRPAHEGAQDIGDVPTVPCGRRPCERPSAFGRSAPRKIEGRRKPRSANGRRGRRSRNRGCESCGSRRREPASPPAARCAKASLRGRCSARRPSRRRRPRRRHRRPLPPAHGRAPTQQELPPKPARRASPGAPLPGPGCSLATNSYGHPSLRSRSLSLGRSILRKGRYGRLPELVPSTEIPDGGDWSAVYGGNRREESGRCRRSSGMGGGLGDFRKEKRS